MGTEIEREESREGQRLAHLGGRGSLSARVSQQRRGNQSIDPQQHCSVFVAQFKQVYCSIDSSSKVRGAIAYSP
jgi:hypothetical protein